MSIALLDPAPIPAFVEMCPAHDCEPVTLRTPQVTDSSMAIRTRNRTPNDVKHWLHIEQNTTVKAWAQKNGYSYHNVAAVMCGRNKAAFGKGREIAVKLGLKDAT